MGDFAQFPANLLLQQTVGDGESQTTDYQHSGNTNKGDFADGCQEGSCHCNNQHNHANLRNLSDGVFHDALFSVVPVCLSMNKSTRVYCYRQDLL